MSEMKKKFDLNEIINNVKSMISPDSTVPNVSPDDAIGMKIAELSTMVQQLSNAHAEQAKELAKVNKLLNGLFKDIEALRNPKPVEKPEAAKEAEKSPENPTDENKPE